MTCCFFSHELVEPPVIYTLSKQGAHYGQVKRYNKLSITSLVNPQIFSINAKLNITQKGLGIGSICQF